MMQELRFVFDPCKDGVRMAKILRETAASVLASADEVQAPEGVKEEQTEPDATQPAVGAPPPAEKKKRGPKPKDPEARAAGVAPGPALDPTNLPDADLFGEGAGEAPTAPEKPLTMDELKIKLRDYVSKNAEPGRLKVLAALEKRGVKNVGALKPEDYAAVAKEVLG